MRMCRIGNIVNVTIEIDNFFPGMFNYCNVRVTDEEMTDLMKYWQTTYDFINRARCSMHFKLTHSLIN